LIIIYIYYIYRERESERQRKNNAKMQGKTASEHFCMFPAHSPYSPENHKMSRSHNCHNFGLLRKHIKTGLQKNIFSMFQELSQALRWLRWHRF
jgi:hypothetical protein